MKIYYRQLASYLNKLPKLVLVFGDDIYIRNDILDKVRARFAQHDEIERVVYYSNRLTDWETIHQEYFSLSLFSQRRIIEINFEEFMLSSQAVSQLKDIVEDKVQDNQVLLLFHGNKLSASQQKSKLFQLLMSHGLFFVANTLENNQYMDWVRSRLVHYHLHLDEVAFNYFSLLFEGNLMAAEQSMMHLALLEQKNIDILCLQQILEEQSQYVIYHFIDALLINNIEYAVKILMQLKNSDVNFLVIIRAVIKELILLLMIADKIKKGVQWDVIMRDLKIWKNKGANYKVAIDNLNRNHYLEHVLAVFSKLELEIKQGFMNNVDYIWQVLIYLCIYFDLNRYDYNLKRIFYETSNWNFRWFI